MFKFFRRLFGGSSRTPTPPDYTAQKGQIRRNTETRYNNQANDYNTAVGNFNNALSGYQNDLNTIGGNVGNMSIADLYDNPNTPENENMFGSNMAQLNNISSGLGSLSMNVSKPVFSSSVGSEYGTVGITNIPMLHNVNTNLHDHLSNTASNVTSQLNALQKRRQGEEQRVSDFRGNLLSDLSQYETNFDQMGIADLNKMNKMAGDLAALNTQRNSFSSSILDQMYPGGFQEVGSRYAALMSGLQGLRNKRSAEEQRIGDFKAGLLRDSDSYRNRLGGYTIANEDGMNALQQVIDDRQRQAGRFSSALDFTLDNELGELSETELQLSQLQRKREEELSRIGAAQTNTLNQARAIEQAAETGNIYSAAGLNAISDNIRDLRTHIGGFSSLLPYDFSKATGSLTEADSALASLNARRSSALDQIAGGIGATTEGLSDIDLYNSTAINDRLAQLRDIEGQLAPFSGGRVDDIQGEINTGVAQVNTRLKELADYRSNLEKNAQSLLEQVNNASYYATGDLNDDQASYKAIQAEAKLYEAKQAMDEIDAIMKRLTSEQQRLEADAEAVAARNSEATSRMNIGTIGLPEFRDLSQVDPYTQQQYLALINQNDEEEQLLGQMGNSGFSNNLGIIRVGG